MRAHVHIADVRWLGDAAEMRKLSAAALSLSLVACSEQVDESYATWAEAARSGAIERGWVPAFVPHSARDIRDSHNLDTNAQTLQFTAGPSDVQAMVAGLRPAPVKDKDALAELIEELGAERVFAAYMVCSEGVPGALAVDHQSGRVLYKTPVPWADGACPEPTLN